MAALNPAQSTEIFKATGRLVDSLGEPGFTETLRSFVRGIAAYDNLAVMIFAPQQAPRVMYGDYAMTRAASQHHFRHYFGGAYRLDPFYQACWQSGRSGLYHLSEVAPDRFFQSEYYRAYYSRVGLVDEIGIISPMDPDLWLHLSLTRNSTSGRFSKSDCRHLSAIEPLLTALMLRNWRPELAVQSTGDAGREAEDLVDRILAATAQPSGKSVLTRREAEVTAYVLRGHSSASIAAILGRSLDTIKVHRRHIYGKLNIASQAELFATLSPFLVWPRSQGTL